MTAHSDMFSNALDRNDERAPNERPVETVARSFLTVDATHCVPVYASSAWSSCAVASTVDTALIILHGRLRNADAYYASALRAVKAAGRSLDNTVVVVPQYLAHADIERHNLPSNVLHWEWTSWMGGDTSLGPVPVSSFEVLDAIVEQIATAGRFPSLRQVIIAGHSGGAQVVHRYAVVTRVGAVLATHRLRARFVIANPSSYVYFDDQRPCADGVFVPFDASRCPAFNHWKYGPKAVPKYIGDRDFALLEREYMRRDVWYLLGEHDCSPTHPALDVSCAAMAQGPHRLARGQYYFRYLQRRHANTRAGITDTMASPDDARQIAHHLEVVPGVGHDGDSMLTSEEGVAALFGDL